jgi:fatty-acyl-CoA synthase
METQMEPQKSFYVTDWLDKRARLTPHSIGLVDAGTGQELTYAAWNAAANRTAGFLRSLGVRKGDLVSVHATNCVAYLDLLFACGKLGAILHNLNWRLTPAELGQIIADARPRVLLYTLDWRERVDALRPALSGNVEHVVAIEAPWASAQPDDDRTWDDRAWAERDQHPDELAGRPALTMDDPWVIFYTGGTTGLPKGAIMTHGNMTWNSVNTVMSWGLTAAHTAPLQLPLFHVGGTNIFTVPMVHVGGKTIVCRGFDVDQTFDLIERGGVTHYVAVPTMYIMMQQHPRWATTDFSRLELVISGGAPCPLPVMEAFWARGVSFKVGYGLTEAAANNFWLPAEEVRRRPGSVGFPLFHIDMKIVASEDPAGRECGPDEVGELLIRGPHVTPGYWNRPEATAEVLKDGWLHTGDMARRDADGFFYIMGRSKDMFISGGENVYPAEIESVLHAHPAVAEAAVIGVPHEIWGEVGRAFVARERAARPGAGAGAGAEPGADSGAEPGAEIDEAALIAFLRERLAKYKIPHRIIFVESLPKTAVGKLDKKQLGALAAADDGPR